MEQLTLSWEEAPAKRSASPESARASWMSEVNSCSNMYELLGKLSPDGSFGKTCPEFCHRTKGEPLAPSSGRWQTSGILAHGECLTLNSSEWPSDAGVSFLSDVLEGGQERLQRYSLSPKACQGILRRASKRGKPLPPMLEAALRAQGGGVTAFAQNTRDEVRIQGDGTLSGALAAQPGMKQQTYVAEARAYRSNPLPCPICGSESVVSIDDPQEPEMFWHYSCGCSQLGCELYGRLRKSFDSREDAIADWNKSVLLDCYSVDYKQTPKVNDQLCHTLTHEGDGGIHSAVAYNECLTPRDVQSKRVFAEDGCSPTLPSGTGEGVNIQPVVMASAHYNAEIGEGGGCAYPDCPHPEGCACTSNGEDVFPSLCATDGSKQFIDNQSVNSGRLLLDARLEWP